MELKIGKHQLLLKVIVGSQAYGTNLPSSDIDYKGIYLQSIEDIALNEYQKQIEVTKDEVYYEIGRFLELLEKNNPTIIEMLFTPEDCIVYKHPILDEIFEMRDKFITKKCKDSFAGMVKEQLRKAKGLNKKMNKKRNEVKRKTVLDFCRISMPPVKGSKTMKWFLESHEVTQSQIGLTKIPNAPMAYQVYVDLDGKGWARGIVKEGGKGESNQLRLSETPIDSYPVATLIYNEAGYKMHCKEYKEYLEWDKNKNEARYVDVSKHGQQIDGKNMLHCRRILEMAVEIARGEGVNIRRPNAEYLISIRKGKVNLQELFDLAHEDIKAMNEKFEVSKLPEKVEEGLIRNLLLNIRQGQLKRYKK